MPGCAEESPARESRPPAEVWRGRATLCWPTRRSGTCWDRTWGRLGLPGIDFQQLLRRFSFKSQEFGTDTAENGVAFVILVIKLKCLSTNCATNGIMFGVSSNLVYRDRPSSVYGQPRGTAASSGSWSRSRPRSTASPCAGRTSPSSPRAWPLTIGPSSCRSGSPRSPSQAFQ